MVINTNQPALLASTRLADSSSKLAQSLLRLSSGSKITSPADDSAGLAVSMKLGAEIARIGAASANIANAISFTQTQDGYLQKVGEALTRMSELSVRAQDPTITNVDRQNYAIENDSLGIAVSKMVTMDFNGVSLFSGASLNVTLDGEGNTASFSGVSGHLISDFTLVDGLPAILDARHTMNLIHDALNVVATSRAAIGATLRTLTYHSEQLGTLKNNLSAANSRIVDVNVAEESTRFAKFNILVQSGTAMLAQANTQPQAVLKLLGG